MLRCKRAQNELTVFLEGEIDHCAAASIREDVETLLTDRTIQSLHFDFSDVSFMDSSGIGMIIGRYKTMASRHGKVTAGGLSDSLNRIYRLAGLHRIIPAQISGGKHE